MLKPALQLKLGQQLTMTPQLQQAIKLLQLPVLELQAQVQEALETNVMLEQEEDETIDLASLEPSVPAGDAEGDGTESDSGGDGEESSGEEVVVEMEDPWAETSTPTILTAPREHHVMLPPRAEDVKPPIRKVTNA